MFTCSRCTKPIFSLTFCRTHYKKTYQTCHYCTRPVYAKRVCRTHYRHKKIPTIQTCFCNKPIFMKNVCLQHFLNIKCQICLQDNIQKIAWCKMLCQKHYTQQWRHQKGNSSSSVNQDENTNNPNNELTIKVPETLINHTEFIQSSRSHPNI